MGVTLPKPKKSLPFHIPFVYDSFLIDMDGVLYHGNQILPGVPQFIEWLRKYNKKYLFFTNSSDKTPEMIIQKLDRLGIKDVSINHSIDLELKRRNRLKRNKYLHLLYPLENI